VLAVPQWGTASTDRSEAEKTVSRRLTEGIKTSGFIPPSACDYPFHRRSAVPLPLQVREGFRTVHSPAKL